jgi:6-phosphofructokinase
MGCNGAQFKLDSDQIVCDDRVNGANVHDAVWGSSLTFEVAGPREHLYFDSAKTTAAIVTCGGLCPGVNDVIRGIVMELWHVYRITKILGIRYGYEGLVQRHRRQPLPLKPEVVSAIQTFGGTMLGTSRGPQDATEMVDGLEQLGVDILFIIGGDGTLKGGAALVQEIAIRSVPASPQDNVYCSILAKSAVHAGMAGKTNMLVGRWHDTFVHIPFSMVIGERRKIAPDGDIWRSVLEATGQPPLMSNPVLVKSD